MFGKSAPFLPNIAKGSHAPFRFSRLPFPVGIRFAVKRLSFLAAGFPAFAFRAKALHGGWPDVFEFHGRMQPWTRVFEWSEPVLFVAGIVAGLPAPVAALAPDTTFSATLPSCESAPAFRDAFPHPPRLQAVL